jgi:hypothetical protein
MTAPRESLRLPSLDLDTLEKSIEAQRKATGSAQIYSRSQVLLEAADKERVELEREGKEERADIARMEKMIADMQAILEARRANEKDIAVQLAATLEQINVLRQAGVSL